MEPDHLQQAWQKQPPARLAIDPDLVLTEVRRTQKQFTTMIFWRDLREFVVAILMVPVWLAMGAMLGLPWAWYLMIPVLLWYTLFMLWDLVRHRQQPSQSDEPLRQHVLHSLAQVERQIWVLRNVFWWALVPFALAAFAFVGQLAWQDRTPDWWLGAVVLSFVVAVIIGVFAYVFWLNQLALRRHLEPRRQELQTLLQGLTDEPQSPDQRSG
jgi:hypothetical protein